MLYLDHKNLQEQRKGRLCLAKDCEKEVLKAADNLISGKGREEISVCYQVLNSNSVYFFILENDIVSVC
jgi:hypothetical protein